MAEIKYALPRTSPSWPLAETASAMSGAQVTRLVTPIPAQGSLDAAICLPVRDEAERIGACVAALAGQAARARSRVGLVVGVNNSSDASLDIACRTARAFGVPLLGLQARLPGDLACAPMARRWVMELGARLVATQGALLTTDADSVVRPGWLDANLSELACGSDAVCGLLRGAAEAASLPQLRNAGRRLEWRYRQALLEIEALLDPDPANPWPHHGQAAGPSLAVTLAAYRRIGGLPTPAFGEDKAMIARLRAEGLRIRYSAAAVVDTSCRLDGRARQGFADFLLQRARDPDSPCDEGLEDLQTFCRRAAARNRLHRACDSAGLLRLAADLAVPEAGRRQILEMALDGSRMSAWAGLEAASPLLARRPIRPSGIALELPLAGRLLAQLRAGNPVSEAGPLPAQADGTLRGGAAGPGGIPFDAHAI